MIYLFIYLLISIAIALLSFGKRISFFGAMMINIFLTPIVGLISILRTDNNIITHHYTMTSTCDSCHMEIYDALDKCPDCGGEVNVMSVKDNLKIA